MKEFWIRVVSLAAIVMLLLGYNSVLVAREKDDQIARLTAEIEGSTTKEDEGTAGSYKDGTYTGEGEGFGGPISIEVTIKGGKVSAIDILSAEKEDGAYLEMAKDIIPIIIEKQTWDVDTISGATFSSTGIKNATQQALEKAGE